MKPLTDTQFLQLAVDGDHQAFCALFLRYQPRMKGFIVSLVHSESVADDLVQDIFMRLWDRRNTLHQIGSFDAYLYRTARNAALDHLKSIRVHEVRTENIPHDNPATPYEEFCAQETQLLIDLQIDNMPERRKRVFELSRREGLRNEQISSRLGVSLKTIENHINLALRDIRRALVVFF